VACPALSIGYVGQHNRIGNSGFTALLHHVYDVEWLRAAYEGLNLARRPHRRGDLAALRAEPGGQPPGPVWTAEAGAYRAQPVRRAYIRRRTVHTRTRRSRLEDKLVQRAVVEVLNAIYDTDFLGFSYGFRPGRSPHDALDALSTGLLTKKVNWVLDADIRSFSTRWSTDGW